MQKTFQRSAADDSASATRGNSIFWGHVTDEFNYYKNGQSEGNYFKEYGGGCWGSIKGFLGYREGKGAFFGTHWDNAPSIWEDYFIKRLNSDFNATTAAIKQRAIALFDLETNPNSLLQKFYEETGQTSPSIKHFPALEIEILIDQYNKFIKLAM